MKTLLLFLVLAPGSGDTLDVSNQSAAADVRTYGRILMADPDQAVRIPCIVPFETYTATQITSLFGGRFHPILHRMRTHNGLDIGCRVQTIVSAARGVVSRTGFDPKGLGNYVKLLHGNGYETTYGHLSEVWVVPGQILDLSQPLGVAGKTGLATGVHLHYEIRKHGRLADPLDYLLLLYRQADTALKAVPYPVPSGSD